VIKMQIDSSPQLASSFEDINLTVVNPVGVLATDRDYFLEVAVSNRGTSLIKSSKETPLTISWRWFHPGETRHHIAEGERAFLDLLEPGATHTAQLRVCPPDINGPAILRVSCVCEGVCWFYEKFADGWVDLPIALLAPNLWPDDVRGAKQSIAMRGYVAALRLQDALERAPSASPSVPPAEIPEPQPEPEQSDIVADLASRTLAAVEFPPLNTAPLAAIPFAAERAAVQEQLPDLPADPMPKLRWLRHPIQSLRDFLLWVLGTSSLARDTLLIRQQNDAHSAEIAALQAGIASVRDAAVAIIAEQERRRSISFEQAVVLFHETIETRSREDRQQITQSLAESLAQLNRDVLGAVADATNDLPQVLHTLTSAVSTLGALKEAVRRTNMPVLQTLGLMAHEHEGRHGALLEGLQSHAHALEAAGAEARSWRADQRRQLEDLGQLLSDRQREVLSELLAAALRATETVNAELEKGLGEVRSNLVQIHAASERLGEAFGDHRATTLEFAGQVAAHRAESSQRAEHIFSSLDAVSSSLGAVTAGQERALAHSSELHSSSTALSSEIQRQIATLKAEQDEGWRQLHAVSALLSRMREAQEQIAEEALKPSSIHALEANLAELKAAMEESGAKLESITNTYAESRAHSEQLGALVAQHSQAIRETVQQDISVLRSEVASGVGILGGKSDTHTENLGALVAQHSQAIRETVQQDISVLRSEVASGVGILGGKSDTHTENLGALVAQHSQAIRETVQQDISVLRSEVASGVGILGGKSDTHTENLGALVAQHSQAIRETVQQDISVLRSEVASGVGALGGKSDILIHRQVISAPKSGVAIARNGLGLFAIPDSDLETLSYYSSGFAPEPGSVSLLQRLLQPGACFLDVGANIGLFTVAAGRVVGPAGRVISIEPAPDTMSALEATVRLNGLASFVELHSVAAGSEPGEAALNVGKVCGHSSLYPIDGAAGSVIVRIAPLDAIIGDGPVDLIKIDVEGFELDAIKGLRKTLSANADTSIIVEFAPTHLARSERAIGEWESMLSTYGFKPYAIDEESGSLREVRMADLMDVFSVNLLLARGKTLELIRT